MRRVAAAHRGVTSVGPSIDQQIIQFLGPDHAMLTGHETVAWTMGTQTQQWEGLLTLVAERGEGRWVIPGISALIRSAAYALISGLLLGLGARLVMRAVALSSGMPGSFSSGGTLEVILFGSMIGFPVAFAFFQVRHRLRLPAPWGGVLAGFLLFLVLALFPPPSARSALAGTPDPSFLITVLFATLFVICGLHLEAGHQSIRRFET